MERRRDLRRKADALEGIVEVQPGRRVPARRVDRPGIHADELALSIGELVPGTVQGSALEVEVVAGADGSERQASGASGSRTSNDGTETDGTPT
jgi:hypothetical protein